MNIYSIVFLFFTFLLSFLKTPISSLMKSILQNLKQRLLFIIKKAHPEKKLILIALAISCNFSMAQNVEWAVPFYSPFSRKVLVDKTGNIFVHGDLNDTLNINGTVLIPQKDNSESYLAKFNKEGKLLNVVEFRGSNVSIKNMEFDPDDNILLAGTYRESTSFKDHLLYTKTSTSDELFVIKLSNTLELIFSGKYSNGNHTTLPYHIMSSESGGILIYGREYWTVNHSPYNYGVSGFNNFLRFRADGQLDYMKVVTDTASGHLIPSLIQNNSEIIVAEPSSLNVYDISFTLKRTLGTIKHPLLTFLDGVNKTFRMDSEGNYIFIAQYTSFDQNDQPTLVDGKTVSSRNDGPDGMIIKYDKDLNLLWYRTFGGINYDRLSDIIIDQDDNIFISGNFTNEIYFDYTLLKGNYNNAFIAKYNKNGTFQWVKAIGETFGSIISLASGYNGEINFSGYMDNEVKLGKEVFKKNKYTSIGYLAKLKDFKPSLIRGNIYQDKNLNCTKEDEEKDIKDIIIMANHGLHYSKTDTSGNYVLRVDTGEYEIAVTKSPVDYKLFKETCLPLSYKVHIHNENTDTSGFNFALHPNDCAFLEVDFASSRMRRCFKGLSVVSFHNRGAQKAENVVLEVTYPDYVTPLQSEVIWSKKEGNLITYSLGDLLPGEHGEIKIIDSILCGNEEIRGLTQCVKVKISPAPTCDIENPAWDKADLTVHTTCNENKEVRVVIKNIGTGNMNDSTEVRLFFNGNLGYTRRLLLTTGDSTIIMLNSMGETIRAEVDQVPFHPYTKIISSTNEGCSPYPYIYKGYYNKLAEYNIPSSVTFCLPITDSYDPNDKTGFPNGTGYDHAILSGSTIDYIIRFQNTGTDTAYNVVLVDTLNPFFDISTLNIGVASHPFEWELSGKNKAVLKFSFKNINLPDISKNELKSNGFVKYSIALKKDLMQNEKVHNEAFIYFDYNSPIKTNKFYHTVISEYPLYPFYGEKIIQSTYKKEILADIKLTPNPFSSEIKLINHSSNLNGELTLRLFDSVGKLLHKQQIINKEELIYTGEGYSGIIYYELMNNTEIIERGKLLKIKQ